MQSYGRDGHSCIPREYCTTPLRSSAITYGGTYCTLRELLLDQRASLLFARHRTAIPSMQLLSITQSQAAALLLILGYLLSQIDQRIIVYTQKKLDRNFVRSCTKSEPSTPSFEILQRILHWHRPFGLWVHLISPIQVRSGRSILQCLLQIRHLQSRFHPWVSSTILLRLSMECSARRIHG